MYAGDDDNMIASKFSALINIYVDSLKCQSLCALFVLGA